MRNFLKKIWEVIKSLLLGLFLLFVVVEAWDRMTAPPSYTECSIYREKIYDDGFNAGEYWCRTNKDECY